jgi:hypothetical protein
MRINAIGMKLGPFREPDRLILATGKAPTNSELKLISSPANAGTVPLRVRSRKQQNLAACTVCQALRPFFDHQNKRFSVWRPADR